MTADECESCLRPRLASVRQRISAACERSGRNVRDVTLIAVTKTVSNAVAGIMTRFGVNDLGENRPQELWKKQAALPQARFHLIGHLQRNKLDRTVPLCTLLHSVDSERLAAALSEFGIQRGSPVPVLLEVNCSREANKGGFAPEILEGMFEQLMTLRGVSIQGLMTMAAHHDDPEHCRPAFAELRNLRDKLQLRFGVSLPQLSMGMSNDFEIAIEEGATHIRVGSVLFEGLTPSEP